eukprot:sb/3472116/
MINAPTHIGGRILNLCFTNDPECVNNFNILDSDVLCSSDHFPFTFDINMDVKNVKEDRRKVLLFDKGDFESICAELSVINWTNVFILLVTWCIMFLLLIPSSLHSSRSISPLNLLRILYFLFGGVASVRMPEIEKRIFVSVTTLNLLRILNLFVCLFVTKPWGTLSKPPAP